ncbi:hypothetical protein ABBQ32_003859 [Trebouxia sp. C0010 RCD-2024]
MAPPPEPQVPASIYWQRTVVKKRRDPKNKATVIFEEVPGCPGWSRPSDENLRQIKRGDQGTVYYVQRWWLDSNRKLRAQAAAMKVLPYQTPNQRQLFDREEANLRLLRYNGAGGQHRTQPFGPTFFDAFKGPAGTPGRQGHLIMSYLEGDSLAEYIKKAMIEAKKSGQQLVHVVMPVIKRLLQTLAFVYRKGERTFGVVQPDNVMLIGKTIKLVDWGSSLAPGQEAITGFPATLGFLTPEATRDDLWEPPSTPLGLHTSDVYAVGVMGLLFLCPDMEMPFGPTKKEIFEMQHDPAATAVVRKSMISSHNAWAAEYSVSAGKTWPASFDHLLSSIPSSQTSMAESFFLTLLHPDPAARPAAAEAVKHGFINQS